MPCSRDGRSLCITLHVSRYLSPVFHPPCSVITVRLNHGRKCSCRRPIPGTVQIASSRPSPTVLILASNGRCCDICPVRPRVRLCTLGPHPGPCASTAGALLARRPAAL
ncbi:hypothetical protein K466DRAFT_203729 [Polyporus arcularius HHB13444]|uniref:Uncharacterized protein n=1 Tax=Polyporus arcularius HHB13444 TaxID=1314778 RepID=A0A5C3P805_9APHY|nr:hypothetical protein K466DRAFT_203729 [Polyporus arcularius HHB13444]